MSGVPPAVRVGPADLGRRVSLRVRTADGDTSDTVGVLTGWDTAGAVSVLRRDGRVAVISATALVAGIVVAPEWGAYDLQAVAQDGWRPGESTVWRDWTLRWSAGTRHRANSARVGAGPIDDVPAALSLVARWYAERGGRPLLQSPLPSVHDPAFDTAGWPAVLVVRLLTCPTRALLGTIQPAADVSLTLADAPDDAWLAAMDEPPEERDEIAAVMQRTRWATFATVRSSRDGSLLGIARASVTAGPGRRYRERWAGVTSVHVLPEARRRGVGGTLMRALAGWSADQGAEQTYLQVLADNDAATGFYLGLGFTPHHDYAYRTPVDRPLRRAVVSDSRPGAG